MEFQDGSNGLNDDERPVSTQIESRLRVLNPGPTHYECVALPPELRRRGY